MDFFSKTKESLLSAGTALTQKANGVSGAAMLTMKIHEEEKSIQNSIAELGKIMLEQHQEEVRKLCPELFYNIQDLKKQLDKDKKELAICKGLKICPNCGAEQQANVIRCTSCGMDMQEAANMMAQNQPVQAVCKTCGAVLQPGCAFCSNCGTRVE